jgi:S-adenosylmethionine-diacylglycerol 3-amino-3-carboxypropyl transferase
LPNYDAFFEFFGCANRVENVENYYRHVSRGSTIERAFWEVKTGSRNCAHASVLLDPILRPRQATLLTHPHPHPNRAQGSVGILGATTLNGSASSTNDRAVLRSQTGQGDEAKSIHTFQPRHSAAPVRVLRREMGGTIVDLFRERVKKLLCGFPVEDNYFAWQALGAPMTPIPAARFPNI